MTVKEMRERRGKIAHDMHELTSNFTPENRQKFDLLDQEQKDLKVQIDAIERAAALEAETRATAAPPNGQPNTGQQNQGDDEKRYNEAFSRYLKYGWEHKPHQGIAGISPEDRSILSKRTKRVVLDGNDIANLNTEYRDFNVGTSGGAYPGSTTGFFVPVGFVNSIESALKYYGDMLGVSTIMETATGQQLPFPTDNDTTVMGEMIGEGTQVSTQDVSIGQIMLGAYKFSTKMVKVSIELLQDSAFALEPYLVDKFGIRLGRILNNKFTLGSGSNEPQGIITGATVGLSASTTPAIQGDDNATSPDPTQQFGYLDLVNLEHSVDRLYRGRGAKWMFHDTTLRYFKTLKDKYGRALWTPGMTANAPDTILNYPFSINNDMAQLGAGNITVVFGQLDKYLIRRVKDMTVLRLEERFADFGLAYA
jgi:HK97 family phage major capsid protein